MEEKRIGALIFALDMLLPSVEGRTEAADEQTEGEETSRPRRVVTEKEAAAAQTMLRLAVNMLRSIEIRDILCMVDEVTAFLLPLTQELKLQTLHMKDVKKTPGTPMLVAMRGALEIVSSVWDATILFPFNMAFVRPHSLLMLHKAAQKTTQPVLRLSMREKAGYPCMIDQSTYNTLIIRDSDGGIASLLKLFPEESIDVPDGGVIHPVSSSEDIDRLERQLHKGARPDEETCYAIMDYCGAKEKIRAHLRVVSEIALEIAKQLAARGHDIDPELTYAGALLHGIAKGEGDSEKIGARWVADLGYPEVAEIIACCRDLPEDAAEAVDERAVVFLADKLVRHNRPCTIDERYVRSLEIAADPPDIVMHILKRREMARRIQQRVFDILGMEAGTLNVLDVLQGKDAIIVPPDETPDPWQTEPTPSDEPIADSETDETVYSGNVVKMPLGKKKKNKTDR